MAPRIPSPLAAVLIGLVVSGTVLLGTGLGQQATPPDSPPSPPAEVEPVVEPTPEERSLAAIASLRISILAVETEIEAIRKQLKAAVTTAEQEKIAEDLQLKNRQRDQLVRDLETVATGVDLDAFAQNSNAPADISKEFEDFLRPIIGELKDLTSKPREIEGLRTRVGQSERQIEQAKKGIEHLDELLAVAEEDGVVEELRNLRTSWTRKLEQAQNDLSVAQFKLAEAEESRSSLFSSAREVVASFWRTRGRNFLTAVFAFVLVWFLLRLLYRRLLLYSPFHRKRDRSFYVRLVDVAYQVFALFAGIFAAVLVLYAASDWVLLGLLLIFLAGLAWASKQAAPRFFEQAKLMLNLGSVREGERVVFNGVPWQVKQINVYTDLENPALMGGHLRLPIRDLAPLTSRPFEPKELWFPTREGDWIVLSDGTYGRVIQQTPEWVTIIQLGGARKIYATPDFIGLSPRNLSLNYRVHVTFGIDYQHQPISTKEVPAIFQQRLEKDLLSLVEADEIINIGVEFETAGASSLDYAILADFAGSAASKNNKLTRAISRICVDVCNEQGWVIPFTQITLHQAPPPSEAAAGAGKSEASAEAEGSSSSGDGNT